MLRRRESEREKERIKKREMKRERERETFALQFHSSPLNLIVLRKREITTYVKMKGDTAMT